MEVWWECFKVGWNNLTTNRLRSALTALTVALGAGAIALLVSLASSAIAAITQGIDAVGGRQLIFVEPKKPKQPTAQAESRLTPEDATALRERVPGLTSSAYFMKLRNQILLGNGKKADVDVAIGTICQTLLMQQLVCGEWLPGDDQQPPQRVVLVAKGVAEDLFGSPQAALSQGVFLWGERYRIIGVTTDAPTFGFNMGGISKQRAVFMPVSTAVQAEGIEPHGIIVLRDNGTASHELQMAIASSVLSWRHRGVDDFEFFDFQAFISKFDKVFAGLRVLVGLVAAVSLFIAGAGIMNVMLASVRQRVSEIGIRRALGASQRDIRRQFAIESILLAGVGGVVGSVVGTCLAVVVGWVAARITPAWVNAPSWTAAICATVAALVVGLLFGMQPARRAASFDVVDCLRGQET